MPQHQRLDAGQRARPFIKWAGGKGYLLDKLAELLEHFPCARYDYCEPMVGGGAVFFRFASQFRSARIADINPDLTNLYRVIQNAVDGLIQELRSGSYLFVHKSEPATLANYYRIRGSEPTEPVQRAARIIYLLKTSYNGLMRVNRAGRFNVAPGSYRNPTICDEPALRAAARALAGTTISGPEDAAGLIRRIRGARSFLFVDPPYDSPQVGEAAKKGRKFTGYSGEFGEEQQAALVRALLDSGCPFVYTNRATEFIVELFEGSGAQLTQQPLKHSIQPRYTTGRVESELVAFRDCLGDCDR
jgi:DNA adenine methylase